MGSKAKALLSPNAGAPTGLTAARNGLGPERVIGLQRARILAAMVQMSVERGAGNVTVAHVVECAGVSRRTFYEIFADREACLLAALDEAIAHASRCVLDAYEPKARWAARIRAALVVLLELFDAEPGTAWLLLVGSLGAGAAALERRQRVLAQIAVVIDEGREQIKNGDGLPPLTAEGVVGGVLSVLHSRLVPSSPSVPPRAALGVGVAHSREDDQPANAPPRGVREQGLLGLTGPLMAMIVLPYLGASAARKELARPIPKTTPRGEDAAARGANPLMQLEMRLTYRTVRVLMAVAAHPGSSNRVVAEASDVTDQGQMSKLLARLAQLELIANTGAGPARGEPNAWTLTDKGWRVQGAIAEQTTGG